MRCAHLVDGQVLRTDAGTTEHDGVSVHWLLPEMGEELSTATIELTANASLATLMPFSVELHSKNNICNVEVSYGQLQGTGVGRTTSSGKP